MSSSDIATGPIFLNFSHKIIYFDWFDYEGGECAGVPAVPPALLDGGRHQGQEGTPPQMYQVAECRGV